jgi:hypothetical protein
MVKAMREKQEAERRATIEKHEAAMKTMKEELNDMTERFERFSRHA